MKIWDFSFTQFLCENNISNFETLYFQVLLIFMQRMEMLLSKTPPADVKSDVLPMIYRALESDTAQIQELCLSIIPGFAGKFLNI